MFSLPENPPTVKKAFFEYAKLAPLHIKACFKPKAPIVTVDNIMDSCFCKWCNQLFFSAVNTTGAATKTGFFSCIKSFKVCNHNGETCTSASVVTIQGCWA